MVKQNNLQLTLYEIDFNSVTDFEDINIVLSRKSWKKFENNLFKKAGY